MNMTMTCIIECLNYADPVTVGADGVFVRPRMFDSASMCAQECLIVHPCAFDLWSNVVTAGAADFPMCVQDCLYLRQMALAGKMVRVLIFILFFANPYATPQKAVFLSQVEISKKLFDLTANPCNNPIATPFDLVEI